MPPKMPKIDCDMEPFFQYHNRLASFSDWKLDWELNGDKPSPEALARAGFFSFTKAPYHLDNVVCPYCKIALDKWEPNDDPKREHQRRSRDCDFVLGKQKVRDMGDGTGGGRTATNGPTNGQNGTSDTGRSVRASNERAVGASKANGLALAGADGEEPRPPQKRRPGRPRKQPTSG